MKSSIEKLKLGLIKTKSGLFNGISKAIGNYAGLDENFLDQLEETLLLGDVGIDATVQIIENLRQRRRSLSATGKDNVMNFIKEELELILADANINASTNDQLNPQVISVIGINGVGKTTTIGKLAHYYRKNGKKVLLAAADTFRAAAIDQLEIWAERAKVDIVKSQHGADPASVVYDAQKAAKARNIDFLIIDTAGRLHTKANLMAELEKIHRILGREVPGAPHQALLIIDATTGQNGLFQAKQFASSVDVTGLVLTKLDGTAKGGIVFSIAKELKIPVQYIGLGEKIEDIEEFDSQHFVEALFS